MTTGITFTKHSTLLGVVLALAVTTGSALAVTTFTEDFNTNDAGWLNADSAAVTYNATGGVGNSGYISTTPADFISDPTGPFGSPFPLAVFFRGNAGAASGDAFVGDWLTDGITTFSLDIRHNHTSALNFYGRLARSGPFAGQAASTSFGAPFILPNVWTTISIDITDSDPPFASYGAGSFNSVFSDIQNLQLGLYLPASTSFTNFTIDVDNVGIAIPEPSRALLAVCGLFGILLRRNRRA